MALGRGQRKMLLLLIILVCLIKTNLCNYFIRNSEDLDKIPVNISDTTTDIVLKDNDIATVAPEDLADLPLLRRIDFTRNKFTELPNLCIVGATLKTLLVRSNALLTSVPLSHLDCLEVLQSLDLANTGLSQLPDLTPVKDTLKSLYLCFLELDYIPADWFQGFEKLQTLDLNSNNLVEIPDLAYIGNTLMNLWMQKNSVGNILPDTWQNVTKLTRLNLEGNNMTHFPDLRMMKETLTDVYVQYNPFEEINSTYIQGLENLERITFGGENIKELPDFTGLDDKLMNLQILSSQLVSVPDLGNMTAIEMYSIKNNIYITHIPYDYFDGWSSLKVLDISDVPVTVLPNLMDVADTLTGLYIAGSAITVLPFEQMTKLTSLETLDVRRTDIVSLPSMCTTQPGRLDIDTRGSKVDVCHCDNLWLKYVQENGAKVKVDGDFACKDLLWETLSTPGLGDICHVDSGAWRYSIPKINTKNYFCGFPLHMYHEATSYLHCTKHCLATPGCVSFNFRKGQGQDDVTGHTCALVAPSSVLTSYTPSDGELWDLVLVEQFTDPG